MSSHRRSSIVVLVLSLIIVLLMWLVAPHAEHPALAQRAEAETAKANAVAKVTSPSISRIPAPGTLIHVVKSGETLPGLVRSYLAATSYMTVGEFDAALRAANGNRKGIALKPGESLVIPGVEPSPIVERPDGVSPGFEVRALYLTGLMASSEHGLQIIKRWHDAGGNAVVFDAKDSDGIVNVPFEHPLALSGHTPYIRNLPKLIRYLHSLNMHAIVRIAIFRDEQLVVHHPELAVHSRRSGQPWRENGKLVWTDPSQPQVQDYDIALARQAASAGADEIQFDYVRFPAEGDQKDAKFDFETTHPTWQRSDVIADFLDRAYAHLHPRGVLLSLDVFGVMAWQRSVDLSHTGQDIPRMAKHCDVLSPMIYPSHFFGMDGYAAPGDAPEHFIGESMDRFAAITTDTNVVLRPWLQAFAWRTKTYSPEYILKQVETSRNHSGDGFLFWNARNDYGKPFAAMPVMMSKPQVYFGRAEVKLAAIKPPANPSNAQSSAQKGSSTKLKAAKDSPAAATSASH